MAFNMQVESGIMGLKGAFTLEEAASFRESIQTLISQGVNELRIDFSQLKYLDSAGIGALVSAERSFRKVGGCMQLTNVSPDVLRVIRTMKLDSILNIEAA